MAHTPNPWAFLESGSTEAEGNACRHLTICSAAGDDLANVYSRDDATVSISREEAIANAHLIAAAPDLLAALQNLEVAANSVRYCYDKCPENFAMALTSMEADAEVAREAIKKATGAA